jgi:hypothetical protein
VVRLAEDLMTVYCPLLVSVLYGYRTPEDHHEKYVHVHIRRPT